MGIHIKGKVQGLIIGDGVTMTTHNGKVTSVNGRIGEEWQERLDAARAIGAPEILAQWYATLSPAMEADACEMFRKAYGRAPGEHHDA